MTRENSTSIPINLSLKVQALKIPVRWTVDDSGSDETTGLWFAPKIEGDAKATNYDPWEMRNKFFRLPEGDNEALCEFLNEIGLFAEVDASGIAISNWIESEATRRGSLVGRRSWQHLKLHHFETEGGSFSVVTPESVAASSVYLLRSLAEREMSHPIRKGFSDWDFSIRFPARDTSGLITTTNFRDALALSIRCDHLQGGKMQKCERPDCRTPFSIIGTRKRKYCSWYCGHIESVRKQRGKAKTNAE
jgi:hypothetical protein